MTDPSRHEGHDCSPDCAEFGCSGWTGTDPAAAERSSHAARSEAFRRDYRTDLTEEDKAHLLARYHGQIVARRVVPS